MRLHWAALLEAKSGLKMNKVRHRTKLYQKNFHQLRGLDMHNPVSFNARRFHKVEPHVGHTWAIAAYTPTAFKRCSNENCEELTSLRFSVPRLQSLHVETLYHSL